MAFPDSSPMRGKANVAPALMSIATQFENLGSTMHEIVIDGERVAMWRAARLRQRAPTASSMRRSRTLFVSATVSEVVDSAAMAAPDDL